MNEGRVLRIPTNYYQHFDADFSKTVPEDGFGGWKKAELPLSLDHTALVVMHAWDAGKRYEDFPGWWRVVPYIPRANAICDTVFPPILKAVRAARMNVFHVVGGGNARYYANLPGYQHAVQLAGPPAQPRPKAERDAVMEELVQFRRENVYTGAHNEPDIDRGFKRLDFPAPARPLDSEGIAENGPQLFALCREKGINHLIYIGFAINWCLLVSPGGMAEMGYQYGLMCSTIRQATTAVENKESAEKQTCKAIALWRVALAFGFVYDDADFIETMKSACA